MLYVLYQDFYIFSLRKTNMLKLYNKTWFNSRGLQIISYEVNVCKELF